MKTVLRIIIISIFLYGCGGIETEQIFFTNPQPEGVRNLSQFPFLYRGVYIGRDSSFLIINKTSIVKKYQSEWALSKMDVDTGEYSLNKNVLTDKKSNLKMFVKIRHDSVLVSETNTDTLFIISDNNILRKFKGNLILNNKCGENAWTAKIFSLNWMKLKVIPFESIEVFNKLAAVSESKVISNSCSITMYLKPSKSQFKDILKLKETLKNNEYQKLFWK